MNKDKIKSLQEIIKNSLIPLINADYALLDVPNHNNIGDNLIWEGEIQFLKQFVPYKCLYEANVLNWDEECIKDIDVILFHGGGNWGDLYRECQELRNYITSKYTDKRIIIFPQTVWYNDRSFIEYDCKIYDKHPNVTICVRDQLSYDTLLPYISSKKLSLLPDMAFFVSPPDVMECARNRKLMLMRTDSEIDRDSVTVIQGCDVKDWPTFSNFRYIGGLQLRWMKFKNKLAVIMQKNHLTRGLVDPAYGLNNRNNREKFIQKGYRFLAPYKLIYTTRLHGLILGILMGKDMVIVDNKYNKCSNFYSTWLQDFEHISLIK